MSTIDYWLLTINNWCLLWLLTIDVYYWLLTITIWCLLLTIDYYQLMSTNGYWLLPIIDARYWPNQDMLAFFLHQKNTSELQASDQFRMTKLCDGLLLINYCFFCGNEYDKLNIYWVNILFFSNNFSFNYTIVLYGQFLFSVSKNVSVFIRIVKLFSWCLFPITFDWYTLTFPDTAQSTFHG